MYKLEVLYVLCVLLMGRQRNQVSTWKRHARRSWYLFKPECSLIRSRTQRHEGQSSRHKAGQIPSSQRCTNRQCFELKWGIRQGLSQAVLISLCRESPFRPLLGCFRFWGDLWMGDFCSRFPHLGWVSVVLNSQLGRYASVLPALGAAYKSHSSVPLVLLAFKMKNSLFPASYRLMENQSLQPGCSLI